MLFTIAFDIVSPLIIGGIEDMIVTDFKLNKLFIMVGMYAGILIVSMVGAYVQAIVLQKTGQRIISHLREDLFTHIESLSHEQMNEIPIGKLVTRITNDTNAISLMFTTLLVNLVKNFFVLTGVLVAMFFLNYELTLMVLCIAPFIVLFTVIFRKFSRRAYRKIKDRTTDINTYLSENLSGIKITQIFNREEAKEREFDKKSNLLGRAKQEQILVFGVFRPLVYMLYITTVMCLFYLGGKGYLDGTTFLGQTLTASTIVSFYMYIATFFNPIQNLAEQFNWLQSAFASAEKVFTIMDIKPKLTDAPDAIELDEVRGEIEFRDLSFTYPDGDIPALEHVSFTIRPGESIGLVGKTGSGKTTLVDLILRTYNVNDGQLFLDGRDVNDLSIRSVRDACAYVPQDNFLFSDTIENNIAFGKSETVSEEIRRAAKLADIDGNISEFQMGYQTVLGERGVTVSGGQKQRIAIARALMKEAPILILDDSVSAVDTKTEKAILDNLRATRAGKTTILIAHRISTIEQMDKILFIEDGRLAGFDTHDKLYTENPAYRKMVDLQRLEEEGGAVNA